MSGASVQQRGLGGTAASVTIGCEDLHPARNNIHLLVDAFPPGPQYHPRQPYMKEDDEYA
jgi:hypothetical protein